MLYRFKPITPLFQLSFQSLLLRYLHNYQRSRQYLFTGELGVVFKETVCPKLINGKRKFTIVHSMFIASK